MKIDASIGGNATERTPRGFAIYGSVTDSRGNVTRVQRSSAMGKPRCYVFCADAEGRSAFIHCGEPHAPAPHLDATEARALAAALLRFADDAEAKDDRQASLPDAVRICPQCSAVADVGVEVALYLRGDADARRAQIEDHEASAAHVEAARKTVEVSGE